MLQNFDKIDILILGSTFFIENCFMYQVWSRKTWETGGKLVSDLCFITHFKILIQIPNSTRRDKADRVSSSASQLFSQAQVWILNILIYMMRRRFIVAL